MRTFFFKTHSQELCHPRHVKVVGKGPLDAGRQTSGPSLPNTRDGFRDGCKAKWRPACVSTWDPSVPNTRNPRNAALSQVANSSQFARSTREKWFHSLGFKHVESPSLLRTCATGLVRYACKIDSFCRKYIVIISVSRDSRQQWKNRRYQNCYHWSWVMIQFITMQLYQQQIYCRLNSDISFNLPFFFTIRYATTTHHRTRETHRRCSCQMALRDLQRDARRNL